jgi:hypothetical protein
MYEEWGTLGTEVLSKFHASYGAGIGVVRYFYVKWHTCMLNGLLNNLP